MHILCAYSKALLLFGMVFGIAYAWTQAMPNAMAGALVSSGLYLVITGKE